MDEMSKWSFKERSNYVESLALEYNKALVAIENEKGAKYLEGLREDVAIYKISDDKLMMYKNLKKLIDSILEKLDRIDRNILYNDYFCKSGFSWWEHSYSKSTYYRAKRKALESFLKYFML